MSDEEIKDPTPEESSTVAESKPSYEEVALAKGWQRKEDFTGDPEDWAPAKAWLKTGDILDTLQQVKRQAKEHDELLKKTAAHISRVEADTRAKVLAELKAKQRDAAALGDVGAVEKITEELVAQSVAKSAEVEDAVSHPAAKDFKERNKDWWFSQDAESQSMRAYAAAKEMEIFKDDPKAAPEDVLSDVEAAVKKRFPDKFIRESRSAAVSGPISRDPKPKKHSVRDLDEFHKSYIRSIKRTIPSFDEQLYIQQLIQSGEITND